MQKTLGDYIKFLRTSGHPEDARFYSQEVASMLKMFGVQDPEKLPLDEVVPRLCGIKGDLSKELKRVNGASKGWDVVLNDSG